MRTGRVSQRDGGTSYTSPHMFKRIMYAIPKGMSLGDHPALRAETIRDSCNSSLQLLTNGGRALGAQVLRKAPVHSFELRAPVSAASALSAVKQPSPSSLSHSMGEEGDLGLVEL